MKKTNKIYCFIQYPTLETKQVKELAIDALSLGRMMFQPTYLEYNQQIFPYSLMTQKSCLEKMLGDKVFTIRIHNQWSETILQKKGESILEHHYLTKEAFESKKEILLDYVNLRMEYAQFAYIRSYDEFLYHNIESLASREEIETDEKIQQYPKKKNEQGKIIINGNYFAGFDIFHLGFCFTSCWRMYFSQAYGKILPMNLLREIQQVEKIEEVKNQALMIELYQNPFAWEKESNLHFQRLFRDQTGIDQLSWASGLGVLREPMIEYQLLAGILQVIQYQNDFLQPVVKSQATHFVTRMYQLQTKQEKIKRTKGFLNAQAFFPMINNRKREMQRMIPLMVGESIDEGISAYEFYIRNYLEVIIVDQRYTGYTPVLTFFLPDKHFASIPLKQLIQNMKDITFSEIVCKPNCKETHLSKGNKRLHVEFCPLSLLEKQRNSF